MYCVVSNVYFITEIIVILHVMSRNYVNITWTLCLESNGDASLTTFALTNRVSRVLLL